MPSSVADPDRRRWLLGLAAAASGCSALPETAIPARARAERRLDEVVRFSDFPAGPGVPPGWDPYMVIRRETTRYDLARADGGVTVLRAQAGPKAATGLYCKVAIDPHDRPVLSWRWRTERLLDGADVSDNHADDAPVRIALAFDGDRGRFGFRDLLFFEQVRFFTGIDLPYATLMYVWDNQAPADSLIGVPQTSRIRYLVAESGAARLGQWIDYRRDIVSDFRRAYGEAPGRLLAVGLITDTDDTGESTESYYGDIALSR